jgi:hypothetical protein
MSLIDRVVAAVTPVESKEARRQARAKARAAAGDNDWLALVLQHHEAIETAFAAVRATGDSIARLTAQKALALLLTGHSNAEEAVIYPALVHFGHKSRGMTGYTEQAGAKANMGQLEYLDPMSQEYIDKLDHIRSAVAHHMYEEENDRFLDLKRLSSAEQIRLTERFKEEFDRYMGSDPGSRRPNDTRNSRLGTNAPRVQPERH